MQELFAHVGNRKWTPTETALLADYFFLQLSNQSLQGPVTLGFPLDMHVAMHLFVHPHFLQSSVQGMHALDFWAAAGTGEQKITLMMAAAPNIDRIEFPNRLKTRRG